jgi:phage I-like protein
VARGKAQLANLAWGTAIAAVASVGGQEVGPVETIQLLAMGANPSRNGKPAVVRVDDAAHASRIAAATAAHHRSNDIVIDYDHQTMFGARAGVGGTARAAGWMKRVYATDQGVFADVEWTDAAASALGAREYRYISPVFQHDAQGRVVRIINAALTNTPSLDLAAVASAFSTEEGTASMNYGPIAKALGLGEDASEEEILRAIANLGSAATMTAIASALGAADGADLVAAATALKEQAESAGKPDPAKYVPIATVTELQTSIQSLQGDLAELKVKDRKSKIAAAQEDGRLTPAVAAYASSITDDAKLDELLGALPATNLGKPAIEGGKLSTDGKLTDEQVALCTSMGWDQAEYLAELQKEAE